MSNTLYIPRNRHVDKQLSKLADIQGLVVCYRDKSQRILKNEKLVVSQKKKYIFLRVFSGEDTHSISSIYQYLVGAQNS